MLFAQKIFDFLTFPSSSHGAQIFAYLIALTVFIAVGAFIIETLPGCKVPPGQPSTPVFEGIELGTTVIFIVEYVGQLSTVPFTYGPGNKCVKLWKFFRSPGAIVDLLSILPVLVVDSMKYGGARLDQVFWFKMLRVIRVFRIFKLAKHNFYLRLVMNVLLESLPAFFVLGCFMGLALVVFGSIIYFTEQGVWNPSDGLYYRPTYNGIGTEVSPYMSIPHSMWWVAVTITTVGYGDLYPTSLWGKIVAIVTMLTGIALLALPISVIGSAFTRLLEEEEEKMRVAKERARAAREKAKAARQKKGHTLLKTMKTIGGGGGDKGGRGGKGGGGGRGGGEGGDSDPASQHPLIEPPSPTYAPGATSGEGEGEVSKNSRNNASSILELLAYLEAEKSVHNDSNNSYYTSYYNIYNSSKGGHVGRSFSDGAVLSSHNSNNKDKKNKQPPVTIHLPSSSGTTTTTATTTTTTTTTTITTTTTTTSTTITTTTSESDHGHYDGDKNGNRDGDEDGDGEKDEVGELPLIIRANRKGSLGLDWIGGGGGGGSSNTNASPMVGGRSLTTSPMIGGRSVTNSPSMDLRSINMSNSPSMRGSSYVTSPWLLGSGSMSILTNSPIGGLGRRVGGDRSKDFSGENQSNNGSSQNNNNNNNHDHNDHNNSNDDTKQLLLSPGQSTKKIIPLSPPPPPPPPGGTPVTSTRRVKSADEIKTTPMVESNSNSDLIVYKLYGLETELIHLIGTSLDRKQRPKRRLSILEINEGGQIHREETSLRNIQRRHSQLLLRHPAMASHPLRRGRQQQQQSRTTIEEPNKKITIEATQSLYNNNNNLVSPSDPPSVLNMSQRHDSQFQLLQSPMTGQYTHTLPSPMTGEVLPSPVTGQSTLPSPITGQSILPSPTTVLPQEILPPSATLLPQETPMTAPSLPSPITAPSPSSPITTITAPPQPPPITAPPQEIVQSPATTPSQELQSAT